MVTKVLGTRFLFTPYIRNPQKVSGFFADIFRRCIHSKTTPQTPIKQNLTVPQKILPNSTISNPSVRSSIRDWNDLIPQIPTSGKRETLQYLMADVYNFIQAFFGISLVLILHHYYAKRGVDKEVSKIREEMLNFEKELTKIREESLKNHTNTPI